MAAETSELQQENETQVVELYQVDDLLEYISCLCSNMMGIPKESGIVMKSGLQDTSRTVLQQFIAEGPCRCLQIYSIRQEPDEVEVGFSTEIKCIDEKASETLVLIKKIAQPLKTDAKLHQKVQLITIGNTELEGSMDDPTRVGDSSLSAMYTYVQQSFTPLLDAYASTQKQPSNESSSKIGLPIVRKKMKELELALLQYQQNRDIPQVLLTIHPDIQTAVDQMRATDGKLDVDELGLTDRLQDDTFLNALQSGVNRWSREIQKVTRLTRDPASGTALQEINFWSNLEHALYKIERDLASPEIELTLTVLKQAKRYLVTVTFAADHGLGPAIKRVTNCMGVMKDLPIHLLLSATDITQMEKALIGIFTHLRKMKTADQYPLSRALRFIEALSRDLAAQVSSVFASQELMQLPFDQFERSTHGCTQLFQTWSNQLDQFYDLLKDLARRRGTTEPLSLISDLQLDHVTIRARLNELREFRTHHDRLCDVIERVTHNLGDIQAAYNQFLHLDVLDVSVEGMQSWTSARRAYDLCIDRVEGQIISNLTDHLGATKTADEMFRVFSKFNALFFRPRIRGAVQQFQMRLIENVKQDVQGLQEKFKQQYSSSEARLLSTVRDIPPVSGAIIWAKQIERKLEQYMSRVEDVLGTGWEQHIEGKNLKQVADSFRLKLNTRGIFEKWVSHLANVPSFEVSGPLLQIATTPRDGKRFLQVAFDHQIITLFKEVRNLEWLGFRVPYTIKMIAEEAKEKYPYAVALESTLRTFQQTCVKCKPSFQVLVAVTRRNVHTLLSKSVVKHRHVTWDSDGLEQYVETLTQTVQLFQEQVDDVGTKQLDLENLLEQLKRSPDLTKVRDDIQKIVDKFNLNGYANLSTYVSSLNESMQVILNDRLIETIEQWISTFESGTSTKIYRLVLKNQLLMLDPPLEQARTDWLFDFHATMKNVCGLTKIQSSTYDQMTTTNTIQTTFETLLFPKDQIQRAYAAIDAVLTRVDAFVSSKLQYQALWDMDLNQILTTTTTCMDWYQLLLEFHAERQSFDTSRQIERFGSIEIHYQHIQTQMKIKYDTWHKDLMAHYADLLRKDIEQFYQQVSTHRSQLEQHVLEASTVQVIAAVTYIREMHDQMEPWAEQMQRFTAGERLLKKQRYHFPSSWPVLSNVQGEWEAFVQLIERKSAAMALQLSLLQSRLVSEDKTIHEKIKQVAIDWESTKPLHGTQSPKTAVEQLMIFETNLVQIKGDHERMQLAKQAVGLLLESTDGDVLMTILDELTGLKEVWMNLVDSWSHVEELKDQLWSGVQLRKIRTQLQAELDHLQQLPGRIRQYEALESLEQTIKRFKSMNAILMELKTDALKDRHWKRILTELNLRATPLIELTLGHLWMSCISNKTQAIREIVQTAQGELAVEEYLEQVREHWQLCSFDMINYQSKCRIIRGWDDLLTKLEEHLASFQSMKQSPYYQIFAEECMLWEDKLQKVSSIVDFWIDVQRRWVYLEGIFFGSSDIQQQLPKEYSRFKTVDTDFTGLMRKVATQPQILTVCVSSSFNVYHTLERIFDMMGKVQRALGEYLERQRAAFSRFYFVGDEDLLEIIGNRKDPIKIQRHLSKLFAGIASVELENDQIVAMVSREGEIVRFSQPIPITEQWLVAVESQMRQTLADLLDQALQKRESMDFKDWIHQFPAQIILLATQIQWSRSVEQHITSSTLSTIVKDIETTLEQLSGFVLKERSKKYEHLITELVHERDITRQLVASNVTSTQDFDWLYQMRYYFEAESKHLTIQMANALFEYGYEYLGVAERLVSTPLTDRAYLTLTQALHFRLGGNPFGPAGTGKTETVKALGSQLGRFVLVFNCDEHFDFQAMGRLFIGLCQVGAWGCFDEFNRLEERVLSAVSQQILTIQTGLQRQEKTIQLVDKSVNLHDKVGIFVTMNPGYAGRSDLPDNLKQLFRSIAMVAPDRDLIAQVMLFSQGIATAEELASKVVLLFTLCQDQLSTQPHYDFGLRALKSVLVSAGHLKRKSNDEETRLVLRSICETILPKLVAQDIAPFQNLIQSIFPSQEIPSSANTELFDALSTQTPVSWTDKVMQLAQVMTLRHGVMLVGQSGTGKSRAWRELMQALEQVDGRKGESYIIDPKALSKEELYGKLDSTTLEWTDGVFTQILRHIINNIRNEQAKRHWIVFDGDVDPEWAENLNSVLDDNKLLTLPSGERLQVPENVWILIETESLQYATLATVSRCGMVWFSHDTLSIDAILDSYYQTLQVPIQRPKWMSRIISFATTQQKHIMAMAPLGLIESVMKIVQHGVQRVQEYNTTHPDFPLQHQDLFLQKHCIFALLWGLGASNLDRQALVEEIQTQLAGFDLLPSQLLESHVDLQTGQWKNWNELVPKIELSHFTLSNVITTVDTIRNVTVLRSWLDLHTPFILCGPPGSGKSMTLTSTLQNSTEYILATLNFSSGTTRELLLKTFTQHCTYTRSSKGGWILQPMQPEQWLVVFCDEINLPSPDTYGTQRVLTFLRQLIEQNGFYNRENAWVELKHIQFVGACNPPTDVGRTPLSLRFLRHVPVLHVDFPTTESLHHIYGTLIRAVLKLFPNLKSYASAITQVMVSVYHANQTKFTSEQYPHYIYSPRELSRWMNAIYEAIEPCESLELNEFAQLLYHEGIRLFSDRLVTAQEQTWCRENLQEVILTNLQCQVDPFCYYSNYLSKRYTRVDEAELSRHLQARLQVFYEEELDIPLVLFDQVVDHALRIDRVLHQSNGHLVLVGDSGVGKTILSKFVAWMNGMSIFQLKMTRKYNLDDFDKDLRVVLRRTGCQNEKLVFLIDDSSVLSSAFLERMNSLLACGEIPGLFEQEEYQMILQSCRETIQRDGLMINDTEDDLFQYFTRQIQQNLHVVFTMNPKTSDFNAHSATSPALFNRCVVNWLGTWLEDALVHVATTLTNELDFETCNRQDIVQCMVKMYQQHTPRDFIDFIQHYVSLFREKKTELQEKQLHFNVGLDKLQKTEVQVDELRHELHLKERELKEKNALANQKLEQMVQDQNKAEAQKQTAQVLRRDLSQQEEMISEQKDKVQLDLQQAEPALVDAQQSVQSIRKSQLDEIRALARPPVVVRMTIEAVAMMMGETSVEWTDLRKFIRKDDFISNIVNFSSESLTEKQRNKIKSVYFSKEEFVYEKVQRASKACGPLFKWVRSQIDYSFILNQVQPLRDQVDALELKSSSIKTEYDNVHQMVMELERQIEIYKAEYAELITQAQEVQNELKTVQIKVDRAMELINNLVLERERWEQSRVSFQDEIQTITGDALLVSAFLTFSGQYDSFQRSEQWNEWKECLQQFKIPFNEHRMNVIDYCSSYQERVEWNLPNDSVCYENAVLLQRFNRFPLIIDPSNQSHSFLFSNPKVVTTSFTDDSFVKVLMNAIRFGNTLVITDIDTIDPIITPILNHETHKTAGRVLITIGTEEIDYSAEFRLFLLTRDASKIRNVSNLSVVNFTITFTSLETQTLGCLLQSECPEIEKKRIELMKLQASYQSRLRQVEDALLETINQVEGSSILQDDRVIHALEKMQQEANEIKVQVAETDAIMTTVNDSIQLYQPIAAVCTKTYFVLQQLADLSFLYQFNLVFYLKLLQRVLAQPDKTDLPRLFFQHIIQAVCPGLLYADKWTFCLRLAQIAQDILCTSEQPLMSQWDALLRGKRREKNEDELSRIQLLMEKFITTRLDCPDQILPVSQELIECMFQTSIDFELDLAREINQANVFLLCSTSGSMTLKLEELAVENQVEYQSIAMGSNETLLQAFKLLQRATEKKVYLLLRNLHLCPSIWLMELEQKLQTALHPASKIFLASKIHPLLPKTLIRRARVLICESPVGIQASLTRSFHALTNPTVLETPPVERSRVVFLLCWFRAILTERRRYAPIGWSKAYEFTDADQICAIETISYWMTRVGKSKQHLDPSEIPWKTIRILLKQSIFGARIDNPYDLQLMDSFLNHLFSPKTFEFDFQLVKGIKVPERLKTREEYLDWIKTQIPAVNPVEWLGLSKSAETMVLTKQGLDILDRIEPVDENSTTFDAQMSQKIENTNMIDLSKVLMTRQQVALKMKCSLDQLKLVLKSSGQSNGFQVEKIYLFGAIWTENQTIQLSETTIQTELTRVYLEWVHQDDTEGFWTFPVYSTAERSDLVFELNVNPSNSESLDQYRQRAVAFHLY